MKKLLLLSLVLFSTLTVSAQYWYQYKTEADELKGTQARSYHAVKIPDVGIVTIEDAEDAISCITFTGLFNYEKYLSHFTVVNAIFGMYGENGELIGKENIRMSTSDESPDFATANANFSSLGNVAGIRKVASWIRNNKGSIRIIVPRYGKTDFDVTLPTMQSHKEPSSGQVKPKGTSQNKGAKRPVRKK